MTRVAIATCAELPQLDDTERLVIAPLAQRGIEAVPAVWDDPSVDWDAFALTVVRCTWDYVTRRDAFLAWAGRVPRLRNPADVLAWNTDKRYLAELAAAGLPIVPTTFLAPGDPFAAPEGGELVVKPAVSAGSRGAARFAAGHLADAAAHAARLNGAGDVALVQPYLEAVDHAGETALLYLGGRYSHAIAKAALLEPGAAPSEAPYLAETISPREPSAAQRALADRVVAHATQRFGDLLYARVDLVPGPTGEPLVIELELTEPSLFLDHDAGAAERLADAVAAHA